MWKQSEKCVENFRRTDTHLVAKQNGSVRNVNNRLELWEMVTFEFCTTKNKRVNKWLELHKDRFDG